MTRRVLLTITSLECGGAERVLTDIATGLDPQRYEVEVVSLMSTGHFGPMLGAAGIPVTSLEVRRKLALGALWRLRGILRRFRPHILHGHLFHADLPGRLLARIAGRPAVISHQHIADPRRLPMRWRLERWTCGLVDRYLCVSPSVADHIAGLYGIPTGKLTVLPNGLDLSSYLAIPLATRAAADRGPWRITTVGRLDPQKDQALLLRGLAALKARGVPARLWVVGEGPERPRLKSLIAELGLADEVELLGLRRDVPELLAQTDVYVQSSWYEGQGLATVEAMAAGRPVVATDVPGTRDAVGAAGRLVPHGDPAALGDAIAALIEDADARARLGAAGRARATAEFGRATMLSRLETVYDELLEARG